MINLIRTKSELNRDVIVTGITKNYYYLLTLIILFGAITPQNKAYAQLPNNPHNYYLQRCIDHCISVYKHNVIGLEECELACIRNINYPYRWDYNSSIFIAPQVTLPINFSRVDSNGIIQVGKGSIVSAEFYAIRADSIKLFAPSYDSVPMYKIGNGSFNIDSNTWGINWTPPYYYSSSNVTKGYALKAYFQDSLSVTTEAVGYVHFTPSGMSLTIIPEGFLYAASINTTRSNIKDKSTISLRTSTPPYFEVEIDTVEIDSITLTGNCYFNNAPTGHYYIAVKHRNSIETWSANPVSFSTGNVTLYDFTTSSSKAFGNNMVLKLGKWCIYSGDVNQSGSIDLSDVIQIYNAASSFTTGNTVTDITGDLVTDLNDILIAYNNAANFVQVQRP